ncbi:hypothetical protein HBB16_16280 [Pseudonocardia sp. MCCB 268]|nr:hypothetical protein [Pseudonocardia cytotoxica]
MRPEQSNALGPVALHRYGALSLLCRAARACRPSADAAEVGDRVAGDRAVPAPSPEEDAADDWPARRVQGVGLALPRPPASRPPHPRRVGLCPKACGTAAVTCCRPLWTVLAAWLVPAPLPRSVAPAAGTESFIVAWLSTPARSTPEDCSSAAPVGEPLTRRPARPSRRRGSLTSSRRPRAGGAQRAGVGRAADQADRRPGRDTGGKQVGRRRWCRRHRGAPGPAAVPARGASAGVSIRSRSDRGRCLWRAVRRRGGRRRRGVETGLA